MHRTIKRLLTIFAALAFLLATFGMSLSAASRKNAANHKWATISKSKAGFKKIKLIDPNGVTHASYTYNSRGQVIKAKGLMKPQGKGIYKKARIPRARPAGFRPGKDHRGHSIPEAGVADQSTVNISDNLTSQDGFTNLSTKKVWENDVVDFALNNPNDKVTTTHTFNYGPNGRPTYYHNTMKVNKRAVAPSAAYGITYSFANP